MIVKKMGAYVPHNIDRVEKGGIYAPQQFIKLSWGYKPMISPVMILEKWFEAQQCDWKSDGNTVNCHK